MEIYQIKSFLAVVEEESVTRAAKRLYTTPPSVSAHIKALEEELGVQLFERSTKGMKLTSPGFAIRDKAERLLAAALEISAQAASLRGQVLGGLEIGLNTDPSFLKATQLASQLRSKHPRLELNFVASDSSKIIDAIRTASLDAGFIYAENELRDLEIVRLKRTELNIVVPSSWRQNINDDDWQALTSHPWIYTNLYCAFHTQIEEELESRNLALSSHVKCEGDAMRYELVANGMGIGVMEAEQAQKLASDSKAFIWKCDRTFHCDLKFAYQKRRSDDPAINAAAEAVRLLWS